MKIIHVFNELKFSGAEIMYVDAAPLFKEIGCELSVVATAYNLGEYAPYFERAGYHVLHKPYPPLRNYGARLRYYRNFINFIKKGDYDVVHIHSNGSMWGMSLCAWLSGKKSVNTFHSIFHSNWYSYIYHFLLRWSAKKIFKCKFHSIGDSVYGHELKLYGNKTIKINNWYGINRFFAAEKGEKNQIKKELDISDNTFVLISIGGCDYNKRHHDIINAISIIKEQIPNLLYIHLGTGNTEIEEKDLSENLEVNNYIRFCGNQSDVRKYLIASDIYLMTSRTEGLSITTIEAIVCKIPCVLYDVPGLRDFNKNGVNTILISEDYKILAEKVICLYNNPDEGSKMADKAAKMVQENYNMVKSVPKIYNLYK